MQVKDMLCLAPFSIAAATSITQAARMLRQTQVGLLPVCDEGANLVGVITAGDLVRRGMALGSRVLDMTVEDLMTRHAIWCSANEDVVDVAHLMQVNQLRNMPVKNHEGGVVGVISIRDILALNPNLSAVDMNATFPNTGNACGYQR